MQLAQRMPQFPPTGTAAADVENLLELIAELQQVMLAENDFLRRGLPAALSDLNVVKDRLSERYATESQALLAAHTDVIVADPALCGQLIDAGHRLRELTLENMQRLNAAMAATRARIDAVMAAIRQQDGVQRGYGRQGRASADGQAVLHTLKAYRGGGDRGFKV
jgi:phosphoenolpyruvate-protein kinase (PTS system EI component)